MIPNRIASRWIATAVGLMMAPASPLVAQEKKSDGQRLSRRVHMIGNTTLDAWIADPCRPDLTDRHAAALETDWEKQYWISKVSRKLLAGAEPDPETRAAMAGQSREEIVQALLADPRFGDTVLDFNLYFLGFKRDSVRDDTGRLTAAVYNFPQAINSARNVLGCGNYLALFELRQPIFPAPAPRPRSGRPPPSLQRAKFLEGLDYYLKKIERGEETSLAALCNHYIQSGSRLGNLLFTMGLPGNLAFSMTQWLVDLRVSCSNPDSTLRSFSDTLKRVRASFEELTAAVDRIDMDSERDLLRLTPMATHAFGNDAKIIQFAGPIRQSLTNSSTNFNRKRAAYVLDRFFCDSLTPIKVEAPAALKSDRHETDPNCFACHNRLDPVAGFFKDYGNSFSSFANASFILFDDLVVMEKEAYDKAWLAPPDTGRKWNIGYIRSPSQESLNSYGTTLDDLFRIITTAPEVKRCLVKRMHQYFVGEDQTIDAGYLDHLTNEFVKTSAQNSSRAFKELAGKLVLSRAFLERDAQAGECYDFAPGHVPDGAPPCRANHLLETNCVSCHGRQQPKAGLDLSRWVQGPDGRMTFFHLAADGRQLSRDTTLQRISDRLSDSDPAKRMPLGRYMNPLERQDLFVWVNEILQKRSQ